MWSEVMIVFYHVTPFTIKVLVELRAFHSRVFAYHTQGMGLIPRTQNVFMHTDKQAHTHAYMHMHTMHI